MTYLKNSIFSITIKTSPCSEMLSFKNSEEDLAC